MPNSCAGSVIGWAQRPRVLRIPKAAAWLSAYLAGALVPSLGWNRSVYDILFTSTWLTLPRRVLPYPVALTPVHAALDQAISTLD